MLAVDRRNRAVGAAAGAAVTLSLMELRPVGPLGFTALIGTVLFVSMCVSAYQRIGRAGRRRTRLTVIGAAVVIVAGLIVAGVVLIGQVNPVESAVDNTRRGAAAARDGETAAATELLERSGGGVWRHRTGWGRPGWPRRTWCRGCPEPGRAPARRWGRTSTTAPPLRPRRWTTRRCARRAGAWTWPS
ncbi:MAG: hypothetical protein IPO44_12855 [Candidatus Microthrix sp.]|nr:hypothetical protein [Candidatus Microthrix sp.]MBK9560391.1 hypothetical protein [Candidatus Microthrix sp.]